LNNDANIFSRLRANKPALTALFVICLAILLAVFAYPLAPDNTPSANTMTVELSAQPPGFRQQFLMVPRKRLPEMPSFWKRFAEGTPARFTLVPIEGFAVGNGQVTVYHHVDNGIRDTLFYSFSELEVPAAEKRPQQWIAVHCITTRLFLLGTDRYGRDILSRLLIGTRVSITVGIVSVAVSLSIGILLGALAGWYGGRADSAILYLINILWAIPTLLLVFAITLTIGNGFWQIFVAIGLTSWVSAARMIRGQVMQLKEMDFIMAAKALGLRDSRIIFRHILPNIAGPVMVIAAANFATAILVEAGLSFLGVGVQPPTPSWGLMIKEHYNFLIAGKPLPALIPGIAIMILVLAFNLLGNGLRDAVDVRD